MGDVDGGHQAISMTTIGPPATDTSFLDLMRQTVSRKGNDVFATWYDNNGKATNEYTFEGMWEEAGVISHYLRNKWKLKKGDRVLLCYNFGLHFFASFLGCLRAGVIAVLVHPPGQPLSQSLPKMNRVTVDCDAKLILIDSVIALGKKMDKWNPLSKTSKEWPDDSKFKVTDKLVQRLQGKTSLEFDDVMSPDDTAFLQYTSGSTGDPKGVMVTFGALHANVRLLQNSYFNGMAMAQEGDAPSEPSGFSWLPQYHDLGLVHGTVAPFVGGWRMHMMSPVDFVRKPLLWLGLMSQHHIDWGVSPDFGYSLVARKFIEAKAQRDKIDPIPGLNLKCLRYLQSGAEPVRATTVETFGKIFAEYGLRHDWFVGSYGLAEHVVGVCFVHGYHLSAPRDEDKFSLIACGSRHTFEPDLVVKIVNHESLKEMKDGETGEVWISGPSVAAGYFGKPELSQEVFGAEMIGSELKFLRTGDLAFFQDDKLFICGRLKDLIIINGVNYYPQDVENTVQEASPGVRPGCVAAFSSSDTSNDLVVVFEIRKASQKEAVAVIDAARRCVMERIGLLPSRIVAIKERTIPKTTSGKIRRRATQNSLHEGGLDVVLDWTKSNEVFEDEFCTKFFDVFVSNEEDNVPTTRKVVQRASVREDDMTAGRTNSLHQLNDGGDSFSETANLVRCMVASVLGVPPDEIPLNRPLYELGLTSILVIQLVEALSNATGEYIPPSIFHEAGGETVERIAGQLGRLDSASTNLSFHTPNVMELCQSPRFLKRLELCSAEECTSSIPDFDKQVYPLTRVQQRMLLAHSMDPDVGVYNVPVIVKLREEGSIQQVEAAFRGLMRLHPVLCTRYVGDATLSEPSIGLVDLQLADEFSIVVLDEAAIADDTLGRISQEPFNLQTEASIRVYYVPAIRDLVMVFHHIAMDGGSLPTLAHHLSELYENLSWTSHEFGGRDYIDFAWREFERESKDVPYDVSFWMDHLGLDGEGNVLPILELPEDPGRNLKAPFTHAVEASVDLTDSDSNTVVELSRLHNVTPFVVYLCVFEVVLKCFTVQNDHVLGVTVNLRPGSHSHALGMFVNTVALRLRNSNCDSTEEPQHGPTSEEELFSDLMQRRSLLWKSALEHANVPFDMVASHAKGHKGVYQASFNYLNDIERNLEIGPLTMFSMKSESMGQSDSLSMDDLEFTVSKSGVSVKARECVWGQGMIQRFLDCYVELLTSVTRNHSVNVPCRKLNLLPESQISLLNNALVGCPKVWEHQLLMIQFFEKTVDYKPNSVALRMMDKTMTYQQVEDRANQFARCLLEDCGVKLEDRVGILLPRGFDQIIALLAILKAGCAYVPLDDTYPELRIAAIMEDSRMVACITTEQNGLCQHVQNCLSLTIENPQLDEKSATRLDEVLIYHNSLCYVLYTSGSTGKPKGVEVEHRSVCNLGLHLLSVYPNFECPEDNFLLISRLSWDTSVANIVFTFGSGGILCLVPPELSGSLTLNLSTLFSEMNITRSDVAPGLLQYLDAENLKSLREIMTGGDVVLPNALKQVVSKKVDVRNEYGPTEATVMVTQHLVTGSDPSFLAGQSVSIGRPISNVRLYVLDKYMNQVPVGVVGELHISGASLARGYTDEEETRAVFVDNPFVEECASELPNGVDMSRLYRTGDLVRVLPNGLLDFVGRANCDSSYIKLRGYRIELREISIVLESHEFVDRAVVMVDEQRQQMVAFAASSCLVAEEDLQELCRSRLVDYAVPSKIIVLDGMPLDANGKIDRKLLAASIPQTFSEEEVVSPDNEVEELLVKVFAQVMGLSKETVSVTADVFHNYGANSLTAAQFVSEIRRLDCVGDFSVQDVYNNSSLRQLAVRIIEMTVESRGASLNFHTGREVAQLDSASRINLSSHDPDVTKLRHSPHFLKRLALCRLEDSMTSTIVSEDVNKVEGQLYPLTRVQQRMLLAQSMDPDVGVYNAPVIVTLREEVSMQQLEVAFRALMRLHPVLCTRYVGDATVSEPLIGLVDFELADEFSIVVLDEAAVTEANIGRILQEPFNLQTEASIRVFYVPATRDLVMVFHHIAMDGGSMPVLADHLSELYVDPSWTSHEFGGRDYIDFAWREFERETKDIPNDISFWTEHLSLHGEGEILPVLELPEDPGRNRNAPTTQAVEASVDLIDYISHNTVVELSRLHNVTPFVVYLCVFEVVLKCFTGQNDLVMGVTVNLRPGSHSHALGMFVNTIALRLRNANFNSPAEEQQRRACEEESFYNLLQRRSSFWNLALEHADVPFDMVASHAHGRKGVFQAFFNYLNDLVIDNSRESMPSMLSVIKSGTTVKSEALSKFDLEFTVSTTGVSVKARECIWSLAMLKRFLDCYVELLTSVTSNLTLDVPCRKLSLIPKAQIRLLNDALVGCPEVWGRQLLMHQFFEKTVDAKPYNVALRMMDERMTYRQVEDRANQFARCLRDDCGVELEDRVGILLPRGFDQIIALLAILKAGCAYVPLDDTYPELRIAAIIEDSRMVACITTERNGLFRCVRDCLSLTIENPQLDDKSTRRISDIEIIPDNLCYVLYTSGSTGRPKGVEVEHRLVGNLGLHLLSFYPKFEYPEDNFLLVSRLSWDVSVRNIIYTFGSGGTLCLVPPDLGGSLVLNIDKLVSDMDITRLDVTPALLQYLDVENQKSLKELLVAGDVVMPKALKQVLKNNVNVTNEYGPTEANIVTQHAVTDSDPCFLVGRSVSIGRPIPNVRLYVLDKCMNQVPVGVLGELYIGGACLARGYTDEAETRAAFVDNPFAEECASELSNGVDTSRLYRTGDFVRVLGDGLLDFVGRVKSGSSYIKLRGYRIELREISAVLENHEFVDRAVVLIDEPRQLLVAFIASSNSVGEEELQELCRSRLVDYAVPSKIIVLDAMPLDPNGKIDRKALAASIPQTYNEEEVVAPDNEVEELLVKVFAQALGLSQEIVSVTADIFHAYGANSLSVAQFVSDSRKIGCVGSFSVRDVYESSSLRQLAIRIIEKQESIKRRRSSLRQLAIRMIEKRESITRQHSSLRQLAIRMIEATTPIDNEEEDHETSSGGAGESLRRGSVIPNEYEHRGFFMGFVKILVFLTAAILVSACSIPGIVIIDKFDEGSSLPAFFAAIASFIGAILFLTWTLKRIEAACIKNIDMIHSSTFSFFLWCVTDRLWHLVGHIWISVFGGTLWLSAFYRWFGADVGRQVLIEDTFIRSPCLVSIGDRAVVLSGAKLETLRFREDGSILLGRIEIKNGSSIGVRAVLGKGSCIGANSDVGALTYVAMGRTLDDNSILTGTSYRQRDTETGDMGLNRNCNFTVAARCVHIFAPFLIHLPNMVYLGCNLVLYLYLVRIFTENRIAAVAVVIVLEPLSSIPTRLLAALAALVCRRALMFRSVAMGDTELYSVQFYRKWIAAKLYTECVRDVSGTIASRLLTRLLGGKVDVGCNRSDADLTEPELTEIGQNVFFANNVKLRNVSFHPGGRVQFDRVVIGDNSVLMDKCVVQPGAKIGADTTIGALTVAPENLDLDEGSILIGNPPFMQPGISRSSGYWRSYLLGVIEYFVVSCFTTLLIQIPLAVALLGPIIVFALFRSSWEFGVGVSISIAIGILLQPCAVGLLLFSAFSAKRLLIGNSRKFLNQNERLSEISFKIFRYHLAIGMVVCAAGAALSWVDDFGLTRWFWRFMGATLGKRVMIHPMTLICETDMLAIGDDSRVDDFCTLFCHTYRNGKLELEPVSVGSKSTVGALSVVLPGSTIGDETELLPLTHVMPGEHLISGVWHGNPAERRT